MGTHGVILILEAYETVIIGSGGGGGEIFYGGSCDLVIRKSCELAAKGAESLKEGETVLYLNVLTSEVRLERELQAVCRSRGGAATRHKVLAMTLKPDDLLSHTSFIERTIESYGVRLVVLNSFDFAALMPGGVCG